MGRTGEESLRLDLHAPSVIATKRDGGTVDDTTLRAFLDAYLRDEVAEEQMAAFLMAGVLRGFSDDETVTLTRAMVDSGDVVDLSGLAGPTVDKHSTGGVGDCATLVVAPVLAACGIQVAKLSGRGLGHTGGTLDKLESIPGLRVDLSRDELTRQVAAHGLAVAAATTALVPLDKRLYALRDVTATVPDPSLIAASVMSKKIASGAAHVVLDVKVGDGAFMADVDAAVDLAHRCVRLGEASGRRVVALVTDMSQPLAGAVGNALEVAAAVRALVDDTPSRLRTLSEELAVAALELVGRSEAAARDEVAEALRSGAAAEAFRRMVEAQDGDPAVVDDPGAVLPSAPEVRDVVATQDGIVTALACRDLGLLAGRLGAGRQRREDPIDPAVGLELAVVVGDTVRAGDLLGRVHAADAEAAAAAAQEFPRHVSLGDPVTPEPLVHTRVTQGVRP